MNILKGFIFSQYKLHHRSLTGLYIGLGKYWDFQSVAKVEQIIAIVKTHSVSCFILSFIVNVTMIFVFVSRVICIYPPRYFFSSC